MLGQCLAALLVVGGAEGQPIIIPHFAHLDSGALRISTRIELLPLVGTKVDLNCFFPSGLVEMQAVFVDENTGQQYETPSQDLIVPSGGAVFLSVSASVPDGFCVLPPRVLASVSFETRSAASGQLVSNVGVQSTGEGRGIFTVPVYRSSIRDSRTAVALVYWGEPDDQVVALRNPLNGIEIFLLPGSKRAFFIDELIDLPDEFSGFIEFLVLDAGGSPLLEFQGLHAIAVQQVGNLLTSKQLFFFPY